MTQLEEKQQDSKSAIPQDGIAVDQQATKQPESEKPKSPLVIKYELHISVEGNKEYRNIISMPLDEVDKFHKNLLGVMQKKSDGFFNFTGSEKSPYDLTSIPVNRILMIQINTLQVFDPSIQKSE